MNKRIMSLILTFTLCLFMLPVPPVAAYAAEGATIGTSGLCEHHAEHDEACGHTCQECAEQTADCSCAEKCTEDAINSESKCAVCGAEGAELSVCTGQEATACTCGTDDPAIHATNCPAYVVPENPECSCAEKCAEDVPNLWCDVCGVQGAKACMAEGETATYEGTSVTIDAASLTEGTEASGTCWSFDGSALTLNEGYEFTINGDCQFYVKNKGTIVDGTFKQQVFNDLEGTIRGGIFACFDDFPDYMTPIINWGTISGGTFNGGVSVDKGGSINGGTFNELVMIGKESSISGGTFNGEVMNFDGTVGGGAFNGVVENYATITGGTFASIEGNGVISLSDGGSFSVEDTSGFSGTVSVDGAEHTHSYTAVYELSQTAGKHYHLSICKDCPIKKVESRTEEDCTPGDIATCTMGQTCTPMSFS